jgi:ribosomal protein L23
VLILVFYLQKTRRVGKFVGKRPLYKKAYVKLKEGDTIADLLIKLKS